MSSGWKDFLASLPGGGPHPYQRAANCGTDDCDECPCKVAGCGLGKNDNIHKVK